MGFEPTQEQKEALKVFKTGKNMVLEAGAGTGKTSTLKLLAASTTKRGIYVAYNRAIADDARASFPDNVACATAHSLAYRAVGVKYRDRLNAPRQSARQSAAILNLQDWDVAAGKTIFATQMARLVLGTLARFCYSSEQKPEPWMVARTPGADDPATHAELASYVTEMAKIAWQDMIDPNGQLRFTHDCYLKMWQLRRPNLGCDFILLDEAQDANPVIADVVMRQDAQQILVGDACQAIYGWRGAVDAMKGFDGVRRQLSQSFRFGPKIADEANKWLALLSAKLNLRGFEKISSELKPLDTPKAVLCRTNAGTVSVAIAKQTGKNGQAGGRVALVGGGEDMRRLAEAAIELQSGRRTQHPELFLFKTWAEVQEYANEDEGGSDLTVLVKLIDKMTPRTIIETIDRLVPENVADVVVSTAHKAKGREWSSVQIGSDFFEPPEREDGECGVQRSEAMLAYVAVTRAREVLDNSSLAWIDKYAKRPIPLRA